MGFLHQKFDDGGGCIDCFNVIDCQSDLRQFDDFTPEIETFALARHDLVTHTLFECFQWDVSIECIISCFEAATDGGSSCAGRSATTSPRAPEAARPAPEAQLLSPAV